ncbi:MAG: fumarylacetoacetate hydrolase family protein [Proteiniphilum sp.]|nr:fumarylacetoacetate hydrolase family protein [Proteiniphilum sp.]
MKIFAIGLNYDSHNKEMNRSFEASEPVVFMKPDTSLLRNGNPFFLPDFSERIEYETEIVVKINRLGRNIAQKFAHRYYDELTVGIDFTARDLQMKQKQKGLPWEISKSFDGSAPIGEFVNKSDFEDVNNIDFRLDLNGNTVQQGNSGDMIYSFDKIIAYVSQFFTLKIGDLIYTGTPAGVGTVSIDDHLQGYIEDKKLLDFKIK